VVTIKESIIKILIEEGYLKDQKKVKAAIGGVRRS
jgi:deoxyribose-phosphate aldolase